MVYFRPIIPSSDRSKFINHYRGFQFIFEQKKLLNTIYKGKSIPYKTIMGDRNEICTKLDGWNYVESNEDIEYLMNKYGRFHDSFIVSLNYISGSKRVENGLVNCSNDVRQVSIIFDTGLSKIELVFEGTLQLNLRPSKDDYDSIIYSATITLEDEIISFFDDDVVGNPEEYEYTWIKALGLRWRFIDEGRTT